MTTPDDRAKFEAIARRFHETYERLAPQFGYETRADTRAFDPESPNGKLMIAVCAAITAPSLPSGMAQVAADGDQVAFNAAATAPDHIWLELGDDLEVCEVGFSELSDVTWSEDSATIYGVEYIRADLAADLPDEVRAAIEVTAYANGYRDGQAFAAALIRPDSAYPLPDDLYAGSKDWAASNYAGRVEWLHVMYESAKGTIAMLEARPDSAAPAGIGRARKVGGSYQAEGTVVSTFTTLAGETRYVFEFDEPKGMLHIFGPSQIEVAAAPQPPSAPKADERGSAEPNVWRCKCGQLWHDTTSRCMSCKATARASAGRADK